MKRILSELVWITLLVITPRWLFDRVFLPACERAMEMEMERLEALHGETKTD